MKVGELCAGYGGISLGLRLAGEDVDLRWLAEFDPALDPLHPTGVPNLGDITQIDWSTVEPVDLLTAGFPCQPFSAAGSQLAEADPRYLWPAVRDAIEALMPDRVLLENVRNLVSIRKGIIWAHILDDLTSLGYDVTWLTMGACTVGAAHHRHRVFALAKRIDWHVTDDPDWMGPNIQRLDVQECGVPRGSIMVPTATMIDHKDSRNETSGRQPGSAHHGGTTLGDFAVIVGALLPSPSASSYGSNQGGPAGRVGPSSPDYDVPARLDLLPTPSASENTGAGHAGQGGLNLRTAVVLLPTPQSRDSQGRGTPGENTARRRWDSGRRNLDDDLALLPTPAARDGASRGVLSQGQRKSPNLGTELALLPSPRASDGVNGGPGQRGSSGDLALPSATQPVNFDRFQAAVDRHAAIFGPPPAPTEPNRNGAPRLSAAFAEWLMCIPAGHVTDALSRRDALKAIGNGVCPPQLAAAWRLLIGVDKPNDTSIGSGAMTQSTSADVKEIQDRNAAARGRVIEAAQHAWEHGGPDSAIEAAMMELAAVWREDAAWFTVQKRKGHVSISKELTQAAARLAAFAVGLTTRPILEPTPDLPGLGEGMVIVDDPIRDVIEALPEGDTVAAIFTSPTQLTGDEPIGTQVTVGGVEFTKIGTDPFGGEESALPDIVGPLGASVTATIDHPFTNPNVPWLNQRRAVEVIPFHELPIVAAATPPRGHVSHSYVETYEGCSLSAMLRDASRAGHVGAQRPNWATIGGKAFHAAVESIERVALSGIDFVGTADDVETLWLNCFDHEIKETMDALVGTPYADSATWYISNRGKEGFDWWRVEGAKMLALYVKHHTPQWRAANPTFLLQDKTPVIELPYEMSIRSLDGERGLTAQGFIDHATLNMETYSLTVLDYKTGSREPESTFQLGEYGHALLMAMGIANEPADRPILGRYWLARKGIYTDAVPVVTRHPLTELQYRYDAAARGTKAGIFSPHVTNLCKSCSVTDYCPAQAGRS